MTAVKYSTTQVSGSIKSNNIVIGNDNVAYGPTSQTGFYAGITPPASGYTIYSVNSVTHIPTAVVANNDTELIYFAKSFGGSNISTTSDAINYFLTGSTGTTIANMNFPNISTSGLTLCVDGDLTLSYPKSGVIWHDLSINKYDGSGDSLTTVFGNYDWANNITGITISTIVEKKATSTDYAEHPINKWNSGTGNASFVLYHFGDYQGDGQDGIFSFYFTSADNGWAGLYVGTLVTGQTAHFSFQWNSVTGGQAWYNGVKVGGGRYGSGLLGIGGNSSITIYGPSGTNYSKVHHAAIYNRDLSDNEVIQDYYALAMPDIVTNGLSLSLDAGNKISYWGGTGKTWYDLSLNKNNSTISAGVTYSNGIFTYDGTGYTDFHAANLTTTATVEVVAKLKSFGGDMIMGWGWYDVWADGSLGFNTANGEVYGISSTRVSTLNLLNNWHHYIFEMRIDVPYTSNKIYIDSSMETLSQQSGSQNPTPANFNGGDGRIACWKADLNYVMPMDLGLFRVYNRSLSQSEITRNYNAIKGRFNLP